MDIDKKFKDHNLQILKIVGKGTYGNVYLCQKKDNNMLLAVKDVELNFNTESSTQEITNEIKIFSAMKHPNIIQFYGCFYTNKYIMLCMEYATGCNLANFMSKKYPTLLKQQEILFFFSQILLGVNYIHGLNVIHRDLKAENILLTGDKGILVKIADFGISKMLSTAKKTYTVIGTPYYLAPELCEGKAYDTKSDIWALGCLLYEMCTHKRAFEAESLVGLVKAITSGNVHPIDLCIYERGMQDLVDSMLSILAEKRPTVKDIMGRKIILPMIYTVFLDAGNENMLLKVLNMSQCNL